MQNAQTTSTDVSNREILSAWLDGQPMDDHELPSIQVNRQVWDTYHLIGDVMRSNDLAVQPSTQFHARLSRALDAELPIVAAPRRALRGAWRMGLSGAAMAAAVATVVWVAQPSLVGGNADGSGASQVLADATPSVADDTALSAYLEAHRQMAGPSAIRQGSFEGAGR